MAFLHDRYPSQTIELSVFRVSAEYPFKRSIPHVTPENLVCSTQVARTNLEATRLTTLYHCPLKSLGEK